MNGYTVLAAAHGPEALAISERHKGPIHLMLTDVVMPYMNGRELYERLAPSRPQTKVLYMSGYADSGIVHGGAIVPGTAFIPKPFTPEQIRRVLTRITKARKLEERVAELESRRVVQR